MEPSSTWCRYLWELCEIVITQPSVTVLSTQTTCNASAFLGLGFDIEGLSHVSEALLLINGTLSCPQYMDLCLSYGKSATQLLATQTSDSFDSAIPITLFMVTTSLTPLLAGGYHLLLSCCSLDASSAAFLASLLVGSLLSSLPVSSSLFLSGFSGTYICLSSLDINLLMSGMIQSPPGPASRLWCPGIAWSTSDFRICTLTRSQVIPQSWGSWEAYWP